MDGSRSEGGGDLSSETSRRGVLRGADIRGEKAELEKEKNFFFFKDGTTQDYSMGVVSERLERRKVGRIHFYAVRAKLLVDLPIGSEHRTTAQRALYRRHPHALDP